MLVSMDFIHMEDNQQSSCSPLYTPLLAADRKEEAALQQRQGCETPCID